MKITDVKSEDVPKRTWMRKSKYEEIFNKIVSMQIPSNIKVEFDKNNKNNPYHAIRQKFKNADFRIKFSFCKEEPEAIWITKYAK